MANNLRILPTILYNNSDLLVLSIEDRASLVKIKKESHRKNKSLDSHGRPKFMFERE
jgi:hypothetical protein